MIKYTKNHEWISGPNENGNYLIGISEFAANELGDIVYVETEFGPEEKVFQEDVFGTIEAVKTVSDLFMPVDCIIVETNELIEDNPEILNEDPKENWIVEVQVLNPSQLDDLLSEEHYSKII